MNPGDDIRTGQSAGGEAGEDGAHDQADDRADGLVDARVLEEAAKDEGRFIERTRLLLEAVTAHTKARAADAEAAQSEHDERVRTIERTHRNEKDETERRYGVEQRSEKTRHGEASLRLRTQADTAYDRVERSYRNEREQISEKANENSQRAQKKLDEAVWLTETVYEASEGQPEERHQQRLKVLEARRKEFDTLEEHARTQMRKARQPVPEDLPDRLDRHHPAMRTSSAAERLDRSAETAHGELGRLSSMALAKMFRGYVLIVPVLLVVAAAVVAGLWLEEWAFGAMPAGIGAGGLALCGVLIAIAYGAARRKTQRSFRLIHAAVMTGRATLDDATKEAEADKEREAEELKATRDRDLAKAKETYEPILEEIAQRRETHLARIEEKYPAKLKKIEKERDEALAEEDKRHAQRMEEVTSRRDRLVKEAEEAHEKELAEENAAFEARWSALQERWTSSMGAAHQLLGRLQEENAAYARAWTDEGFWTGWQPPHGFVPSVRVGSLAVDRRKMEGGVTDDERLKVALPERFELPVGLDLPDACSLLLTTDGDGRTDAMRALQTVMLRLLTGLPPGKVRFTILDPVGLGQSFAGFMHLADWDEAFVTSRIWTETRHIEQRLADLTEHMENVIQKYLRNEFETIAAYNEEAGEIAEPYRFVVISDFPANFSESAGRRLASIVSSGARCGVYTLIHYDKRQSLPRGLEISDLERHSMALEHRDGKFVFKEEPFAHWPLSVDEPPDEMFLNDKLRLIGEAAQDATRVEVPFQVISPNEDERWSRDAAKLVRVPLGRCGATKLQELVIGQGTSQHALIAGKTGSGKSTLLHVLITNLALWYSPEEIEFYLVDFKKGVEFKTYAAHDLPHARTVAIESDREFGLSVLHRIDEELKRRGDLFRDLGVQDMAGYRALGRDEPMPRTLLVIDEFQEMFIEDDKLGQDAALLMDRLVRQGRAFGIHVLLGSQTLGGAYTLARSTMGQMQIRIALQCTEADSYLILSDDNSAARLLSRPGEAIYNDAGGAIQGNSPFQICWLPEPEREQSLIDMQAMAEKTGKKRADRMIVFEGNAPALLKNNEELRELIERPGWANPDASAPAWLGEAIAIKGPTAATFRRQSGSNLVIIGQQEEYALGMAASGMLSLAAQHEPGEHGAQFIVLDGTPADARTAGMLGKIADALPHQTNVVAWRDVEDAVRGLADELRQREGVEAEKRAPIYLIVYGLQRFRMLRTSDDFGFSMGDPDEPPKVDRLFGDIMRDGPHAGIHCIFWCDTATNLTRTLDRNAMREFEMRVLFQMSGADSTQLIDTPAAAKLGLKRALFFNEESGVLEKFRPYALSEDGWIEEACASLRSKA